MRMLAKRSKLPNIDSELKILERTLNSSIFIMLDLLFLAAFLSLFTYTVHQSIFYTSMIFIFFITAGLVVFSVVNRIFLSGRKDW
ncbi:TRAP-type uncharacterized transport system fused permease subunit [Cytobacillus kochii]|nr:TRAP-type uncharacterized transport system fused permease subunit [Cytobacillus kochii]